VKEGWKSKSLGEATTFLNGLWKGEKPPFVTVGVIRNTNFAKDGSIDDSDIAWLEVEAKKFEKRKLRFGDVILEKSGGGPKQPVGRVALFEKEDGDYSFSNFTSAIRVNDAEELDFRFLHKFLFWKYASGATESMQSHSTGIRNLDADAYKAIGVPLPPLSEQRQIVAILDEALGGLATATANAAKNLDNARELFDSYLNFAIEGLLIPQGSRDESAENLMRKIEKLRAAQIGEKKFEKSKERGASNKASLSFTIPPGWKLMRLEELTSVIADGVHQTPKYVDRGIPFVTIKNLTAGPGISFDEINYITRKDHEEFIKRTNPEKGDILITKDGTIGVVRIIDTDVEFSIFVSVALIKPVMRELTRYLAYAVSASCVQRQIAPKGTALKHLYLSDLRNLFIPLPPLAEQVRIVQRLDLRREQIDRLEISYRKKLSSLAELKQSILQNAFSGELTAPPSQAIKEAAE
jgi:type I restriction enzyme, S subunit